MYDYNVGHVSTVFEDMRPLFVITQSCMYIVAEMFNRAALTPEFVWHMNT